MALPDMYTCSDQYFTDAVNFLNEFAWIYQNSNTEFIKAGVLDSFPTEFKTFFSNITNDDLNQFPMLILDDKMGEKYPLLYNFQSRLKSLIPKEAFTEIKNSCSKRTKVQQRKISLKKQHEIGRLADFINESCQQQIDIFVDFGAGLGYLSEELWKVSNNKCLILGLESDEYRVETAQKRQQQNMPAAENKIVYKQQFITPETTEFIKSNAIYLAAKNSIAEPRLAIIGLHACADLTITALKFFLQMDSIKKIVIMPCCYHKLNMVSATKFGNFPLSKTLQDVLAENTNYFVFLNRPFLRLACQQTSASWQNTAEAHKKHGVYMFMRGVAEAAVDTNTEYVVKKTAKLTDTATIEDFKNNFSNFYSIKSKKHHGSVELTEVHEARFRHFFEKYVDAYKLTEGLTCLQTAMQKLCENIVLYDRLCFMQEYAAATNLQMNVRYEKLLDEKLSPRCYVLIAEKL